MAKRKSQGVRPPHIWSVSDLVTTHERVREGFLQQAFQKSQVAQPYVAEAIRFRAALAAVGDIAHLVENESIQGDLRSAAGFSAKAINNLTPNECKRALAQVLETIANTSHDAWRDEILYRYLLTKGDSFGGRMRNLVGAAASIQFTDAIRAALERDGIEPEIVRATKNRNCIQELRWPRRLLVFNKMLPVVRKNIDAIFLILR